MLALGIFIVSSITFYFSFKISRLLSLLIGFSAILFLAQFLTPEHIIAVILAFVVGMAFDLGIVSNQEEKAISEYVKNKKIPWWFFPPRF